MWKVVVAGILLCTGAAWGQEPPKGDKPAAAYAKVVVHGKKHFMTTDFDGKLADDSRIGEVPLAKLKLTKSPSGKVRVSLWLVEVEGGFVQLVVDDPKIGLIVGEGKNPAPLRGEFLAEGVILAGKKLDKAGKDATALEKALSEQVATTFQADQATIRLYRDKDKATAPPLGRVSVQGRAIPGKYDLGDGKTAALAVENGDGLIVVVGDITPVQAKHEGSIRVVGRLDASSSGQVRVLADKVEVVEK
jgi:hypothetical protein